MWQPVKEKENQFQTSCTPLKKIDLVLHAAHGREGWVVVVGISINLIKSAAFFFFFFKL